MRQPGLPSDASSSSLLAQPLQPLQPLQYQRVRVNSAASIPGQVGTAVSSGALAGAGTPRTHHLHRLPMGAIAGLRMPAVAPMLHGAPRLAAALPRVQALHLPAESLMLIKRTTSTVWETVGPPQPEKTFHCPFCLENVRAAERVVFEACGNEGHGVCRECMGHYIRGLVTDGRVAKIECHKCGVSAVPAEVLQLTDPATFRKFERFQQMQQDHTVRECPTCCKLNKPSTDEEGNPVAEMFCEECKTEFCYYHSNAHTGMPCAEYRKRVAREERLAEQGALRDTKACPVCGVRTEKTGGCNHMTCQRCGSDWCWVCGAKLDDVTAHYYFGGPLACGQFDEFEPRSPLSYVIRCITVPLQLLSVLFFVLLSLTMVVWFPLIYIIIMPCYFNIWTCQMPNSALKCTLLCSIVLAFIPFIVFQVMWTMVAAVFFFFLKLFGAERRHLYNLVRSPVVAILPVLICFQMMIEYLGTRVVGEDFDELAARAGPAGAGAPAEGTGHASDEEDPSPSSGSSQDWSSSNNSDATESDH